MVTDKLQNTRKKQVQMLWEKTTWSWHVDIDGLPTKFHFESTSPGTCSRSATRRGMPHRRIAWSYIDFIYITHEAHSLKVPISMFSLMFPAQLPCPSTFHPHNPLTFYFSKPSIKPLCSFESGKLISCFGLSSIWIPVGSSLSFSIGILECCVD